MMKRFYLFTLVLLCSLMTAWATDVTYSPTLEVNFRTATGNTAWDTGNGYPKDASADGMTIFEGNYNAGIFALQKFTVADLQNASKLVLTLTNGSGADAIRVWLFPTNDWSASSSVDDMVNYATQVVGVAPRSTEGTVNTTYLVEKGTKVASTDPQKSTFTISGTALATLKAAASSDGTFTLMLTDGVLTSSSSRKYLSSNTANAEANRPTLVATIETPSVVNKTTGVSYSSLTEAFNAAVTAGTDAELEVNDDQTLTSRLTWNKAATLTITPKADITIKGHRNGMWFLANTNNGRLNIGSSDYTITLDGQSNTFEFDVAKYENSATIALTNVVFQNFDLNSKGHLVGSKPNEGQIILDKVTFKNCSNPLYGFICKTRVTNDRVVLKGYFNQEGCTGTTIYAASETKTSGTTGRIKIDDSNFTANSPITIFWGVNNGYDGSNNTTNVPTAGTMQAGIVVVIGTSADNAAKFQLTDETWALTRKSNGDLIMAVPATPTAQIGETKYADLAAALAAVQDGETIMLLADQELKARVNVKNMSIIIDGQSQYAIKRATSYTTGLLFLTQKPDDENTTALTLQNVTIDGQSVETTVAVIEAGNSGTTTTLNNVTIQNVVTTASAVVNKSGGKLVLKGTINIPSVFVGTGVVADASEATITSAITLTTDANRPYGIIIEGGNTANVTCTTFRLSQQQDGIYNMPLPVAQEFAHPALLHTAANIEAVKANLATDNVLFNAAYQRLEAQSGGSAAGAVEYLKRMDKGNWEATYPDYNNFTAAATDAKLAYQLALRYQLKNSTAAATKAVEILNNWASVNKGMLRLKGYNNNIPDPNEYLICIQAYQFANAAELLRDYTGWAAADQTKFQNWIRQTFADVAILFLENHHNNANALHYWLNWDLAALNAMMSVGILCNDKALVDYALNYVDNGQGTGNKANAIVATHNDTDSEETLAQCQESGRDQGHATLDISLLGVLCQTAKNIGTDLFTPYEALKMAEYVGKYNLKAGDSFKYDNVPFTEYTNGEVTHSVISADARGTERNCWELFLAYAKANDKAAAYTIEWVQYLRNKYAWGEGEATTNDELGFGTLMFATPNDIPSGIETVQSSKVKVESYYDLSGRRVAQPTKGLYIVNGKKVVVK